MPGWLQDFVKVNPISHLVSTVRSLMLGDPMGDNLLWTLGWMALLVAVFVPLALLAYARHA
jgi:oleandomycin transport system permease protein